MCKGIKIWFVCPTQLLSPRTGIDSFSLSPSSSVHTKPIKRGVIYLGHATQTILKREHPSSAPTSLGFCPLYTLGMSHVDSVQDASRSVGDLLSSFLQLPEKDCFMVISIIPASHSGGDINFTLLAFQQKKTFNSCPPSSAHLLFLIQPF